MVKVLLKRYILLQSKESIKNVIAENIWEQVENDGILKHASSIFYQIFISHQMIALQKP